MPILTGLGLGFTGCPGGVLGLGQESCKKEGEKSCAGRRVWYREGSHETMRSARLNDLVVTETITVGFFVPLKRTFFAKQFHFERSSAD